MKPSLNLQIITNIDRGHKLFCIDCKLPLNRSAVSCHTKRCVSCNIKHFHKSGIINNKGTFNGNYKFGLPRCPICGKKLSNYTNKTCKKHINYEFNRATHKTHKAGYHYTRKSKIKLSQLHKLHISQTRVTRGLSKGKNNPGFGRLPKQVSHWNRYSGHNMRSSWETSYAKYLDKNNIKWQYEPQTFNLGRATYTPDFYLPKEDRYIEIKGYWRPEALLKFNLFKSKHPLVNIIVLYESDLKKLGVL